VSSTPAPFSSKFRSKAPASKKREKAGLRKRFNEREFFDRADYIIVRLFLLILALIGMFAVIKDHLK
jgi:hypothetical protein